MPPVGAYGMELALARMLDLGYSLKASEFALMRSGGSVNEAIEELQSSAAPPPRSQMQPTGRMDAGGWMMSRTGPRPRVKVVAARDGHVTDGGVHARMRRSASPDDLGADVSRSVSTTQAAQGVDFFQSRRADNTATVRHGDAQATRAEQQAVERQRVAAAEKAKLARCRRHSAMVVKGPTVCELNVLAQKRIDAASIKPGTSGVKDYVHATKGQFNGTQLTKMDAALGLFSSYLPPDHPVLSTMTQTLQGDEMPVLEDKDVAEDNSYENPWLTVRDEDGNETKKSVYDHSGDTSEEEEEAEALDAAKARGETYLDTSDAAIAQRQIATMDPALYYRQTSSPIASALEARAREEKKNEGGGGARRRPATAPAARRPSERMPTQRTTSHFGRGGVNASPAAMLTGSMGMVTWNGESSGVRRRPATAGYTRGGGGGAHAVRSGGFGSQQARFGHDRSTGPGPGGYNVEAGQAPGVGGSGGGGEWQKKNASTRCNPHHSLTTGCL